MGSKWSTILVISQIFVNLQLQQYPHRNLVFNVFWGAAWWDENSFIVNISQNNPIPLQDEEVGEVWSPNLSNIISIVVHGRDVTELAQIDFAQNNCLYYIMIHRVTGCLERSSVTGPYNFDCNKNKIKKFNTNTAQYTL